jgi:hypothetical protein
MKGHLMMILSTVLLRTCETNPVRPVSYGPATPVSFQQFYDELSPYGDWVDVPNYGYAWVPEVDDNFRPYYTNGNWVATDLGNTWESDYPWGWAPFHYGNWAYAQPHGWTWLPGYDWAPAQVSWRQGDGFYGWAPLMPRIPLGTALNAYNPPDDWWVFVPQARLYDKNMYKHWRGPQFSRSILPGTSYITNVYKGKSGDTYIYGPRANEFARLTGKKVDVRRVVDVSHVKSVGKRNDALRVYRPQVKEDRSAKPSPDKIMQGWAGKSKRGNEPANQKTDARGGKQEHKIPSGAGLPARKPEGGGGKQHIAPERKHSSPPKQQHKAAPAQHERKTSAPKRSNTKPSKAPAQKQQSRPAKQQRTVQSKGKAQSAPQYMQRSQPQRSAGKAAGGQQSQPKGQGGGGKKK